MNFPSKKQKQILDFIKEFIKSTGINPTFREIQRGLNYKSVSTVANHIDNLILKGYLKKSENEARSVELINSSRQAENILDKLDEEMRKREDLKEIEILRKAKEILRK